MEEQEKISRTLSGKEIMVLLLGAIVVIYLLTAHDAGLWPFSPAAQKARADAVAERTTGLPAQSARELVGLFRSSGLLIRDSGSRYWVSLPLWTRLDAQQKERVCLALYTWRLSQGERLPVQILDAQSGASLATYDTWDGFRPQ